MTGSLDVRLAAAPAVVLAAVRTHAAYWQESLVPEDLRRRGLFGVDARIEGRRFYLAGQDLNRDPAVLEYRLEGTVTPEPDGGSRVQARVVIPRDQGVAVALFGAGVVVASFGQRLLGMILMAVSAVVWQRSRARAVDAAALSKDIGAAHLVARLQLAIEAARSDTATG